MKDSNQSMKPRSPMNRNAGKILPMAIVFFIISSYIGLGPLLIPSIINNIKRTINPIIYPGRHSLLTNLSLIF